MLPEENTLFPQFADPRLSGMEQLNESKIFIMLGDMTDETKTRLLTLSTEELLNLAIQIENDRRKFSPFDVAYLHFIKEEQNLFKLALFIENRQKYLEKLE